MRKPRKKLVVVAIMSILFASIPFSHTNHVVAKPNPCIMVKVADLGRCNIGNNCSGYMSRYVCSNHFMCDHAHTVCTNGCMSCNHQQLH